MVFVDKGMKMVEGFLGNKFCDFNFCLGGRGEER